MDEEQGFSELLREALSEPPPPDRAVARAKALVPGPLAAAWSSILARARNAVAELALDTRSTPSLVGFRGAIGSDFHLLYRRDRNEVFIQVQRRAEPRAPFLLDAQIDADGAGVAGCPIAVVHAGASEPLLELRSSEEGTLRLELPAGRYDLALGLDPPFLVAGVELE